MMKKQSGGSSYHKNSGSSRGYKKDASPRSGDADKRSFGKDAGKPERPKREWNKDEKRGSDDKPKRPYGTRPFEEKSDRPKRTFKPKDDSSNADGPRKSFDRKPYGTRPESKPRKPYEGKRAEGSDDRDKDKKFDRRDKFADRKNRVEGDKPERTERKPFERTERKPFERTERKPFDKTERKPFERKSRDADSDSRKEGSERKFARRSPDAPGDDSTDRGSHKPYEGKERKPFERRSRDSEQGAGYKKEDGERKFARKSTGEGREGAERAPRKPFDRNEKKPFDRKRKDGDRNREFGKPDGERKFSRRKPEEPELDENGVPIVRLPFFSKSLPEVPPPTKRSFPDSEEKAIDGAMTLNKYISHSGESSRRDAAEMVKQGKVRVNGELILDPGYRVEPGDQITLSGKKLTPQKNLVYILLNKPKGFITTTEDPEERKTVMDLVTNTGADRLFPVGRLDRNTTGVLLLTNDGALAHRLAHPSYNMKKVYHVTLDKNLTRADYEKISKGVELEDGLTQVDAIAYLDTRHEIGLEIHSGKNRIVRRIFESLGYVVEKLDRVVYAGLTKKNVSRGKWRFLDEKEIIFLKHFKG